MINYDGGAATTDGFTFPSAPCFWRESFHARILRWCLGFCWNKLLVSVWSLSLLIKITWFCALLEAWLSPSPDRVRGIREGQGCAEYRGSAGCWVCLCCSQLFHQQDAGMFRRKFSLIEDVQFRLLLAVTKHELCSLQVSPVAEADLHLSPALVSREHSGSSSTSQTGLFPCQSSHQATGLSLSTQIWSLVGAEQSLHDNFIVKVPVVNPQCEQGLKKKGVKAFGNIS